MFPRDTKTYSLDILVVEVIEVGSVYHALSIIMSSGVRGAVSAKCWSLWDGGAPEENEC